MTYEEFIQRAEKPITRHDYHEYVEPVYAIIPSMTKDFCAEMYDILGLVIFKASKDYCLELEKRRIEYNNAKERLEEML